ncbi:1-phosphofructokinase [Rariglobus hedericola]|uniref:1-phosphofructokinase n=1 Tax=Rariglobus hedericola TaxID=2597822 RepID=A0A556QRD6_9BACT|nr:1-phosphofructokinase [Rariglobus hedericola]TSJ79207.1 1-phosphofructokinase [Rariglobus hedericola]
MSFPSITTLTLNPAIDRTVTIPVFTAGAVNRVESTSDRPGGKGINVAAALAEHGNSVAALGFLGRDNETAFTTFFAKRGIEDHCLRLNGSTRVGIKITDPVRHETTDINFPGLTPTFTDLTALRAQIAALKGGWCVLAGSLPPEVPTSIYREFITTLKTNGVRTVLDSSGEALRQALKAGPDCIKPNVHELEAHLGRALPTEADVIAAAREIVAGGVHLVVVSRGAEGACFVTANETVIARPPVVTVRSTVGAGDAMVAGILTAQLRNLSLADTARLATAFSLSALTRTEDGSDLGAVVEAFVSRVQISNPSS